MKIKSKLEKTIYIQWLIIAVLVILFLSVYFKNYQLTLKPYIDKQRAEVSTTVPRVTTVPTTTSSSTTTTVPPLTECKYFNMEIESVKEFDELGDYNRAVVNLKATYTGNREESFFRHKYVGYYFELKVVKYKEYYYEDFQYSWDREHCSREEEFKIGSVIPEDVRTGCLEFRILDDTELIELIFYDKAIDHRDTCHIKLA